MPSKIEQEIEELLARLDAVPPPRPSLFTRIKQSLKRGTGDILHAVASIRLPRISPGHLLLIAIAIIVGAWVIGGGSDIVRWVIVGGIALFILAFVLSLRRQSDRSRPEKLWRGRSMDDLDDNRPFWERWRSKR